MVKAAERVRVAPQAAGKYLAQLLIVFAAYLVAGKLGQATTNIRSGNLGPVWPAYGIALAAVLVYGSRVWVGIATAAFLVAFLSPIPGVVAAGQAAGAAVAALTGAYLLRRLARFDSSLTHLRDALALIVLGAFGSAFVSASIGVSVLNTDHVQAYAGLGSAWLIYWLGDSTGVLLVTPLVLTAPNLLKIARGRILEFTALLLLLTLACFIIFGDLPLIPVKLHFLAFAVFPFVIWAAIRFGVSGGALSTLLVATIATIETALGSGPFAQNTPFTNAVLLDVFFAVLSVSGMTLSTVVAEREQAERDRERLAGEQAATEARLRLATIVESSDDAIIGKDMEGIITEWNRGAERLYGYSAPEAIGKPISLLVPPDRSGDPVEIMEALRRGKPILHYETVRQRKNGTSVEVSLTVSPIRDTEGRVVGGAVICRDITERKRVEEALRQKSANLAESQRLARIGSWQWDPATDTVTWSEELYRIADRDPALPAISYGEHSHLYTPESWQRLQHAVDEALRTGTPYQLDLEMIRLDGTTRWVTGRGEAQRDTSGRVVRLFGTCQDITERKLAQEALAGVSRMLIEAQEQERTRIARELHDDIGQRLALLTIRLNHLRQVSTELPVEVRTGLAELQQQTFDLATDTQTLSHELHSSKLEYLGVAVAARSFCKEFGEQQKVEIDFKSHDLPSPLPLAASLCLFRVLQEALHNSAKHSGVGHFEVQLWGTSDEIHLTVRDSGSGFDRERAKESRGLGLISMEERLKLLKGTLSIESQPQRGTTIHACVPLISGGDSMRAAG